MGILEQLISAASQGVKVRSQQVPLADLQARLGQRDHDRPFQEALTRPGMSLICEYKRKSPSAGEIAPGVELPEQVKAYEAGGAAALSVLTDETHFDGRLEDLGAARAVCGLPILRKDFVVDEYQLYEAAVGGADAVLLIAAVLDDDRLRDFQLKATELDLDCLVEIHDEEELDRAVESGAEVIGINNRNLDTGVVDIQTTYELITDVPTGTTVVSESGISNREELIELERVGVDAALIGESLMRSDNPEEMVRTLAGMSDNTTEHFLP
ncbi:MAG: indole-3-glycerol phosphate synthase TrpC [Solirubrobacterales bacterium]|nr:indole-3-glycerol phosphate synthase TrpC [Solirubrobacterales bacterium]MCB0859741.1 indole-3-glycerol phosphate synthase TrpC [Solirubrobacterales bacterium]